MMSTTLSILEWSFVVASLKIEQISIDQVWSQLIFVRVHCSVQKKTFTKISAAKLEQQIAGYKNLSVRIFLTFLILDTFAHNGSIFKFSGRGRNALSRAGRTLLCASLP